MNVLPDCRDVWLHNYLMKMQMIRKPLETVSLYVKIYVYLYQCIVNHVLAVCDKMINMHFR